MAPVVTAIQPPSVASKVKRPIPPGIQTNGVISSRSSPSPSMSAKKPPNSATTNGANPQSARPVNRARREQSAQIAARNSRNSAGLRSASLAADIAMSQALEPPPYVMTDEYILKKYAGNPPSLVVHMHPTHFRFDQQDGIFPYKSPMKLFLEHLRTRTVPHDLLDYFTQGGVAFYEGCLIVQVHDHKSVTQTNKDVARPTSASSTVVPSSIHNHNPYIVPSPWVPYPKENLGVPPAPVVASENDFAEKTAEEKDKENMPAPSLPGEGQKSKPPPKPKTFTVVLHPTSQSLHMDLLLKASTPRGASDARGSVDASGLIPPSTPMSLVPPTPTAASMPPPTKKQKRERMELDGSNIHIAESQILLATNAPLVLEPTKSAEATIALLDVMAHPKHAEPPPQPKTRKRTVAEMAADEALAADQERYMLTLDERLSAIGNGAQGGTNGADGEGSAVVATFEPRFERFKVIADIKREHAERKEAEKLKQAENDRRLALQKQQQAQEQQQMLATQRQQEAEKLRREQAQAQAQAQAARENQARQEQRRMAAQAAANQAAANNQNAVNMGQASHPHQQNGMQGGVPVQNGPQNVPNGIPAQAQARFAQASQPQVSSPIIRQGTPHSMSSPMVGSVPMQQSNSNMAASPPRPPSVVQGHPGNMGSIPMAHSMSARGSQQSHHSNTPRMPHSTPNMQATPINRPAVVATPRMSQASPPPNMMAQNSQMGQGMMMNNQGVPQQVHNPNLIAAQVAQQQRAIQQQQMAVALQNGMMNGNINGGQPLTPQQQHLLQQQMTQRAMMMQQQQQQQNQQRGNMMNQQLAQRYAQTLNNMQTNQMNGQMTPQMQAQLQAQLAQQMGNPMQRQMAGGQNMMNGQNLNMQAMMQMQQQQQQQQQMSNNAFANQVKMQGQAIYNKNIPAFAGKWGGAVENIPPEPMEIFKRECMMQAKAQVQNLLAQRRAQQVMLQQQQQQQQQQASMQGMGGMMGPQGL